MVGVVVTGHGGFAAGMAANVKCWQAVMQN